MAKRTSKKYMSMKEHVFKTFSLIFKNLKLFLPLIVVAVLICLSLIDVSKDTMVVMGTIVFLFLWLLTLFFTRHLLAGRKVTFFDGLYNAMTPLIATLFILVIVLIQCIPIFLLIIVYAAAIETNFLSEFGYIVLFLMFAMLMIVISGFLLSDTLVALMAVSAPGMYPWQALKLVNGLMRGKRVGFVMRLLLMGIVLALVWAVVILPVALLALAVKLPMMLMPILVFVLGSFSIVYMAVYLYIYYRKMIGYDEK